MRTNSAAPGRRPRPGLRQRPCVWMLTGLLAACSLWPGPGRADSRGEALRVGVFENMPLAGYVSPQRARGIFPELLEHIARKEGWRITYVPGTLHQHLDWLEANEIDLLATLGDSEERGNTLDFTREKVLFSWGEIYVAAGASVQSVLDLEGKTVATQRSSVFLHGSTGLAAVATQFGIRFAPLLTDDFHAAFRAVAEGRADAALVNRFFGLEHGAGFGLKKTSILVHPIGIGYAFSARRPDRLRETVDSHLRRLKADERSVYYQTLDRWLAKQGPRPLPAWLPPVAIAVTLFLLGSLGLNAYTRRQVVAKTAELVRQKERLEVEIADRLRAEERLRDNQDRLQHLAHHDPLTGLPNRLLFLDRLRHALATAQRGDRQVALLFLDLDRFKKINDSLGHASGDTVLREVARRILEGVREADTVARLGGDEFVIILEQIRSPADAGVVARNVLGSLARPLRTEQQELFVTGSIGISLYPLDGDGADPLMRAADVAMYRAKEQGRNNAQFYKAEMNARTHELLVLESELRRAVDSGQLLLHYQPQFDLFSGALVGVEALVRWRHPLRGLISPGDFIPLAEDSGLIIPIGEWVLRRACSQARSWQDQGFPGMRMAVNISPRQFWQPGFGDLLDRVLADTRLEPRWLELEITESMVMKNVYEAVAALRAIRARGVHLSIDDFGTGYSSLSALKAFPVSKLKIDQSFVRDLLSDPDDRAIVESVIALARSMGLEVIAEGVETAEQMQVLRRHGCQQGQGFLLGYPLPAEEAGVFLRRDGGGEAAPTSAREAG